MEANLQEVFNNTNYSSQKKEEKLQFLTLLCSHTTIICVGAQERSATHPHKSHGTFLKINLSSQNDAMPLPRHPHPQKPSRTPQPPSTLRTRFPWLSRMERGTA